MIRVNDLHNIPWREGITVQDILDHLRYSYALITVTVNGDLVEPEFYATATVPDGAAVTVFHLAHGG